jgi:hypothetical protein
MPSSFYPQREAGSHPLLAFSLWDEEPPPPTGPRPPAPDSRRDLEAWACALVRAEVRLKRLRRSAQSWVVAAVLMWAALLYGVGLFAHLARAAGEGRWR